MKIESTLLRTHAGHKLKVKEYKYIAEFLVSGSQVDAARQAGYDHPERAAYALAKKPYIKEEIEYQLEQLRTEKVASATEILEYLSGVMRGQITDQFGLDAPLSERTKAATELAKRQIDAVQRLKSEETPEIKITLDWNR